MAEQPPNRPRTVERLSPEPPKPSQDPQEARQGDPEAPKVQSGVQAAQDAPAASQDAQDAGKSKKLDETVPGGLYEVEGKMVDANNQPVDRAADRKKK